jgi:hypothetical protein
MNREYEVDEIRSLGGPLICIERRLADQWRGVAGLSMKPDPWMWGVTTDYDIACRRPNRYLSVLRMASDAALILGDMPLITGVWRSALQQLVIWRVFYAEPDDDVPTLLASLPEPAFSAPVESIEFLFKSRNIAIFDSSFPGDESDEESVSFNITPGRYLVTTHDLKPTLKSRFLLHRFHRIV